MKPEDLVMDLRGRGVELSVRGERLHVDAPMGVLTAGLKATLAARKGELMALLREKVSGRVQEQRYVVPDGWTVRSWIERLRQMARICMHPDRATELQAWADGLERPGHLPLRRGPPSPLRVRQVSRAATGGRPVVLVDV